MGSLSLPFQGFAVASSGGTIAFIGDPMTNLSSTSSYGSSIPVGSSSGSRLKGKFSSSANISWLRSWSLGVLTISYSQWTSFCLALLAVVDSHFGTYWCSRRLGTFGCSLQQAQHGHWAIGSVKLTLLYRDRLFIMLWNCIGGSSLLFWGMGHRMRSTRWFLGPFLSRVYFRMPLAGWGAFDRFHGCCQWPHSTINYGTAPQQQPPSIYPLSSIYMLIMSLWLLIGAPQCARHSRTQEFFKWWYLSLFFISTWSPILPHNNNILNFVLAPL